MGSAPGARPGRAARQRLVQLLPDPFSDLADDGVAGGTMGARSVARAAARPRRGAGDRVDLLSCHRAAVSIAGSRAGPAGAGAHDQRMLILLDIDGTLVDTNYLHVD